MRWKPYSVPMISARVIERQLDQLPSVKDVIPDVVRRNSAMLFFMSSIWMAAIIFAYVPPIAVMLALPAEAWSVISVICGALGTLVTTWLVKKFDAKINQKTTETTSQTEILKQTIDWALKERQELYRESEAAWNKMITGRDQEIERLKTQLSNMQQELERLRSQ